jgi:hypothetical protein
MLDTNQDWRKNRTEFYFGFLPFNLCRDFFITLDLDCSCRGLIKPDTEISLIQKLNQK